MRVLVTGATGFLGSHVTRLLIADGHAVRALVRPRRPREHVEALGAECHEADLLDHGSLNAACRGMDGVVHCAARMGFWSRQDDVQRRVIVEGSSALYRAALKARVGRIVHVSSIAAVGYSDTPQKMSEDWPWNGVRLGVHYVQCKREAEERAFAAVRGGMPITVVNPAYLVGPRLDGRPPAGPAAALAAGKLRFYPEGGQTVCDVEDVARATITALHRGRVGERYLIGGHDVTWRELYRAVADALGVAAPRRGVPNAVARALGLGASALDALRLSRPPWTPEVFRSWGKFAYADDSKARRELDAVPRPLAEVVERMTAGVGAAVRA